MCFDHTPIEAMADKASGRWARLRACFAGTPYKRSMEDGPPDYIRAIVFPSPAYPAFIINKGFGDTDYELVFLVAVYLMKNRLAGQHVETKQNKNNL